MFNNMFNNTFMHKSTLLMAKESITRPPIITPIVRPIIMELLIITRPPIITTMGIFITLIMMVHTVERITGTHTGGMLTFN